VGKPLLGGGGKKGSREGVSSKRNLWKKKTRSERKTKGQSLQPKGRKTSRIPLMGRK